MKSKPARSAPEGPWIKICGVTRPEDAELAARLGARFVGVNFWSGSKRRVELAAARDIAAALSKFKERTELVGVFVNEEPERIDEISEAVGLDRIQLHGDESDETVARFASRALRGLPLAGALAELASRLEGARGSGEHGEEPRREWSVELESLGLSLQWRVFAVLLDSSSAGARYGGTGEEWDWSRAHPICAGSPVPVLIAGGVRPESVREALRASGAAGVDVASGVESSSGIKDREKMERLFEEVARGGE